MMRFLYLNLDIPTPQKNHEEIVRIIKNQKVGIGFCYDIRSTLLYEKENIFIGQPMNFDCLFRGIFRRNHSLFFFCFFLPVRC